MTYEVKNEKDGILPLGVLLFALFLASAVAYATGASVPGASLGADKAAINASALEAKVLPPGGVLLPVTWGDLGARLVETGTIDKEKFMSLYGGEGKLTSEQKNLLLGRGNGRISMTRENSGYLLNLLWALGLANKNPILEEGEMADPRFGGPQNFASTGGWTIAKGNAMDHYSMHALVPLTPKEQALVEKVSKGIYRPCCGNSTHFPDCNHGMAMLGLLELMASQGVGEKEMWETALAVNSYWFPDTYLTIAAYMKEKRGVDWRRVNPKEVLGGAYSSASGFAKIRASAAPAQGGGASCGV
ncbi:MAG: hypothetical protein Q8Q36_00270 [bacterium]|nr:hypothetical protein [bacterium]